MNNTINMNNEITENGQFIEFNSIENIEVSSENGIYTYDEKKETIDGLPYLVRVGGGFQAFKHKRNAKRFFNQD